MTWAQRLMQIYTRIVLHHPVITILVLLCGIGFLSYNIKDFELEASADSLFLKNDKDVRFYRKITFRFAEGSGSGLDYLVLTFAPDEGSILSDENLTTIRRLDNKLTGLDTVQNVLTIREVPLFKNPPGSISDLNENIKNLSSENVDIPQARRELQNSPIYQNLLVSRSMDTTALRIEFKKDPELQKLLKQRTTLRNKKYTEGLSSEEQQKLNRISEEYDTVRDRVATKHHQAIVQIRKIVDGFQQEGELFLGGVTMIAHDMLDFIKRDLIVFGLGMLCFIVVALWLIFRRKRWIFLPLLCCVLSAVSMMGFLGIIGWEVTVISSNFISLQLIMTIALAIHITVRYNELHHAYPESENRFLVHETVRTIFTPCLYTCLTTIAGFASLVFSGILPVINFGWMMTIGLLVSLVIAFLLYPSALMLMHRPATPHQGPGAGHVCEWFRRIAEKRKAFIFVLTGLLAVFIATGIFKLRVENSFIDYFQKSTEIYQGMSFIDRNLGGTTPLEVVITFPEKDEGEAASKEAAPEASTEETEDGGAFSDFGEYSEPDDGEEEAYWYSTEKIRKIRQVHNYLASQEAVGKVLSLETLMQVVRDLMNKDELDNFDLAILFKNLPQDFEGFILDPFVAKEHNQVRINARIKDSLESLNRDELLQQVRHDLLHKKGLKEENFRLTGAMVLYNNMLQSLYKSQIQTIGFTVVALLAMFLVLFRSLRVSLIAIFPNLIASLTVLGLMGVAGIPLDIMTITIVAISIGIAVDNCIHYIHRFRHEFELTGNYHAAMRRSHQSIGRALFYIAVTIIVGFSILAISNFNPTILFGLLTALAMAMAVSAALTLLPALLCLVKPFGKEFEATPEVAETPAAESNSSGTEQT